VALKLEEEKPDVFTTSLGNIPPGTKVFIKIDYVTELQMEGEDALRFVLPRRVAPRYTPASFIAPSETIPPTFECVTFLFSLPCLASFLFSSIYLIWLLPLLFLLRFTLFSSCYNYSFFEFQA
jgi:hypothetical protein